MSKYHKELIKTIKNSSKRAEFSRPEFLQTLDSATHDVIQKKRVLRAILLHFCSINT